MIAMALGILQNMPTVPGTTGIDYSRWEDRHTHMEKLLDNVQDADLGN